MAQLTNKHGIPRVFEWIAAHDPYTRGSSDRSITQLIDSPRVVNLRIVHDVHVIEDVSELYWSIMGTAIHSVLEKAGEGCPGVITERRYRAEIEGWTVSGATDVIEFPLDENGTEMNEGMSLQDYKHTSVYAAMREQKKWEAQLNCNRWLANQVHKHWQFSELSIIALLRDWRQTQYEIEKEKNKDTKYPPAPIYRIKIPMWTDEQVVSYLLRRVQTHQQASAAAVLDEENLIACSDEERWLKDKAVAIYSVDHSVAVYDGDGAKAKKVCTSQAEAEQWVADNSAKIKSEPRYESRGGKNSRPVKVVPKMADAVKWVKENGKAELSYEYEERGGEPTRCLKNYCGVAEFCDQHKQWLKDNPQEDEDAKDSGSTGDA